MRLRTWVMLLLGCGIVSPADAQNAVEPPTQLPALLPVPDCSPLPKRSGTNRSKRNVPEYDRSLIYLPDSLPQNDVPVAEPVVDRYWLSPAIYYGWTSSNSTPGRIGYGLDAGAWFADEQKTGIEVGGLYLSQGIDRSTATFEHRDRYLSAIAQFRQRLLQQEQLRLDVLLGYRYARTGEVVAVRANPTIVSRATTNFHGSNVGLAGTYRYESWTLGLTGTVALGESFSTWTTNGQNFDRGQFAVLPTVAARLNRTICERGRAFVGYDFQYLTGDYWFQALNAGVEFQF